MDNLRLFLKETIDDHKKPFDKDNIRDYIDTFINEVELSDYKIICEEQLVICCLDLFAGGSETSSKSLMFFIAYMILYPELQEKVLNEIIGVAPDRLIWTGDTSALPLTQKFRDFTQTILQPKQTLQCGRILRCSNLSDT